MRLTVAELATNVLDVLRHFRDEEPQAWDALTKSESGVLILNLWDALKTAESYTDNYEAALAEIAKREGPFSTDQLTHASNTIDNMASIAEKALGVNAET